DGAHPGAVCRQPADPAGVALRRRPRPELAADGGTGLGGARRAKGKGHRAKRPIGPAAPCAMLFAPCALRLGWQRMAGVTLRNLTKTFKSVVAVDSVN